VRMEITFTKEQFEILQQVREDLSHQVPDGDFAKVIAKLSQRKAAPGQQKITRLRAATMAAVAVNKTLTPKTRKAIINRHKTCQFRSPITGRVCGGRWHLQVDHKQSRWAGGSHDPKNLQALCGQHN